MKKLYAHIEISANSPPIKYEMDEKGQLIVDRFLTTCMYYPLNYGYIPSTHSEDNDPLDILVLTRFPVREFALIEVRVIGLLRMIDQGERDYKILAVPAPHVDPYYANIQSYTDLPQLLVNQTVHFFEHYKDLENKKIQIEGWGSAEEAEQVILKCQERFNQQQANSPE